MPHWTDTLGGSGHTLSSDSIYQSNWITGVDSAGALAAPPGAKFAWAKVWAINGGSTPQLNVRNGMSNAAPLVRTTAATLNATINQKGSPDLCAQGLWIELTGGVRSYEVQVLWI